MNKVFADPEELKKFAFYLEMRASELKDKIHHLEISFNTLSEYWKDPIHEKFKNQFIDSLKILKNFIIICFETSQYLKEKAKKLEDYLNN